VEVDPDTGQMMLLDVVTAHDVGTIINPQGTRPDRRRGTMPSVYGYPTYQ
jgi:CO/xanthine dehydrogenase Mo-binding subunit